MGDTMPDVCTECMESDETEYVVTQDSGGAVGIYCWRCEILFVDDDAVHGDVRHRHVA